MSDDEQRQVFYERVYSTQLRILNVGAGSNFKVGTDFIDKYPEAPKVIQCDCENERFPYLDNTFDEVHSYNIFEHLIDRGNFFKESYRVLKKGGKFVLTTDDAFYFGFPFNSVHHWAYVEPMAHGPMDRHFSLFTHHHLENFLKRFGFKDIKVMHYSDVWWLNWLPTNFKQHLKAEGYK